MEPIGTTANCCAPRSTASSSLAQNQVKNIPNICVWTRRMTTNSCAFWCENAAISIIFAVVVKKKQRKPPFLDIVHEGGSLRTPTHNTSETLRLTAPTPRPMLGISGLLQLLTWVEHRRAVQASQHEEGGVPCPIPHPTRLPPARLQASHPSVGGSAPGQSEASPVAAESPARTPVGTEQRTRQGGRR